MSEFEYAWRPDHQDGEGDRHGQIQPITAPRARRVTYSLGAMSEFKQPSVLPPSEGIA
ncbi:hypothetical protein Pve01_25650 [Planomonospora venezuelensis]|nr:hypothetical protein Pve01_25650 [Planomonospora venezuelensis]